MDLCVVGERYDVRIVILMQKHLINLTHFMHQPNLVHQLLHNISLGPAVITFSDWLKEFIHPRKRLASQLIQYFMKIRFKPHLESLLKQIITNKQ